MRNKQFFYRKYFNSSMQQNMKNDYNLKMLCNTNMTKQNRFLLRLQFFLIDYFCVTYCDNSEFNCVRMTILDLKMSRNRIFLKMRKKLHVETSKSDYFFRRDL